MYCLIFWRLPKFTKIKRCFVDCKFEIDSWCTFWWIFKDFSLSFPQVLFDDITSCEEKIHQRASIVDPSTGDDKWIDLFKNENIKKNAQVFNLHTWTITICLNFYIGNVHINSNICIIFQELENKRKRNKFIEGVRQKMLHSRSDEEVIL